MRVSKNLKESQGVSRSHKAQEKRGRCETSADLTESQRVANRRVMRARYSVIFADPAQSHLETTSHKESRKRSKSVAGARHLWISPSQNEPQIGESLARGVSLRIAAPAVRDFCGSHPLPPGYNESQAVAKVQKTRGRCEASVDFTESQRVTNRRLTCAGVSLRIAARAARDFCGSHPVPPGHNESPLGDIHFAR